MTLTTPIVGKICLKIGATIIIGVEDAPISDKAQTEEVTADVDAAIRRAPVIDDGTFSFTMIVDSAGDAGQAAVYAAKAAHSLVSFTRYMSGLTGVNYTFSGYISDISPDGTAKKNLRDKVTVDVSGGMTRNAS